MCFLLSQSLQSSGHSSVRSSSVSPKDFRKPIKAASRKTFRKPRLLGRSLVATDTPEEIEIENQRRAARKEAKSRKTVRKVVSSSSEEEEEIKLQDTDDDMNWSEENENNELQELTEDFTVSRKPMPNIPDK